MASIKKEFYLDLKAKGKSDATIMTELGINHNLLYQLKNQWGLISKRGRPASKLNQNKTPKKETFHVEKPESKPKEPVNDSLRVDMERVLDNLDQNRATEVDKQEKVNLDTFKRNVMQKVNSDIKGTTDAVQSNTIPGVGRDAETVTNEQGGKQSKTLYRFDLLDPKAMFEVTKVLKEGYDKYGSDENWRKIDIKDHLNHLLIHAYAYLADDKSDDHLSHIVCRGIFALANDLNK